MTFFFWYFTILALASLLIFFLYTPAIVKPRTRGSFLGSAVSGALLAFYACTGSVVALYIIAAYAVATFAYALGQVISDDARK